MKKVINKKSSNQARQKRHFRIRNKVVGTSECPRLNVFRSASHMYAQIIDDSTGTTLVSASTMDESISKKLKTAGNIAGAKAVGELIAKRALEKGISSVVFDRGGYIYHGRVKQLAESAREKGLQF